MNKPAFGRATVVGTVLQLAMIAIGHFKPGLMDGNFFPIVGTALGGVTGVLYGMWAKGGSAGQNAIGGAVAGGVAGVLGSAASAGLGDVPLSTIGIAGVSTVVTGAIGGIFGRMMGARG